MTWSLWLIPRCSSDFPSLPSLLLLRFLAVQRGAVSYPSYPIQRTRPIFSSRQQLLDYEGALGLAARVDAALEVRCMVCTRRHSPGAGVALLGEQHKAQL
jgi:hypothetical protein